MRVRSLIVSSDGAGRMTNSEFTGVTPDAEGRIYLDATAVDAGHEAVVEGHLNGMVITPEN